MATGDGKVNACHSVEEWTQQLDDAKKSNKLIVIDFTAVWCPPCRFIAPIFAELARKFDEHAKFFKIDVDELKTVAEQFSVQAMPTFIFMRGEEILERVVGARKEDLENAIVKHTGVSAA